MVSGIAEGREAALGDTAHASTADSVAVYYLLWRTRSTHPWHSEQFDSRSQAHQRYFTLIERGIETYLERRQARLPA